MEFTKWNITRTIVYGILMLYTSYAGATEVGGLEMKINNLVWCMLPVQVLRELRHLHSGSIEVRNGLIHEAAPGGDGVPLQPKYVRLTDEIQQNPALHNISSIFQSLHAMYVAIPTELNTPESTHCATRATR